MENLENQSACCLGWICDLSMLLAAVRNTVFDAKGKITEVEMSVVTNVLVYVLSLKGRLFTYWKIIWKNPFPSATIFFFVSGNFMTDLLPF